jgi:hypothetical protein
LSATSPATPASRFGAVHDPDVTPLPLPPGVPELPVECAVPVSVTVEFEAGAMPIAGPPFPPHRRSRRAAGKLEAA